MGEFLIIARQPILREALRQFLFPQHHATLRDRWPGAEEAARHDLVIVDRDDLDAGARAVDAVLGVLARLQVPSIWLHTGPASAHGSKGGRIAVLAKPLEGATLEAALRSLLPSASGDAPGAGAPVEGGSTGETAAPAGAIIELTEFVKDPGAGP